MFDTAEVTSSSQCRGEDAVGVSQRRRSVTGTAAAWTRMLKASPLNSKLPQPGTRLGAQQELGIVYDRKQPTKPKLTKKSKKGARLISH